MDSAIGAWARRMWGRRGPRAALVFLGGLVVLSAVSPLLGDPNRVSFSERFQPPVGFSVEEPTYDAATGGVASRHRPGTWAHPLGTDDKGRDMGLLLAAGGVVSLTVGLAAAGLALLLGVLVGLAAGYRGGWVDGLLMRTTDVVMTFPSFVLLLFLASLYGLSLGLVALFLGLTGWTTVARAVRSEVLSLRTREYVLASRLLGGSTPWVLRRHLLPHVSPLVAALAALFIPGAILAEAALSFFLGRTEPTLASWGRTLSGGQDYLTTAWWVSVEPGLLLFATVLAFHTLAEEARRTT